MTEAAAQFVLSEQGEALLTQEVSSLQFRRDLSPEQRAALLAVKEGRERARRRGLPEGLFLTPELLAQASSPQVATWHAQQLATCETVVDCCCGAGLDAIAFARAGLRVQTFEWDPGRALFARANVARLGLQEHIEVICGDVTEWEGEASAAFFDPARREGDRRVSRHGELYSPSLSFLKTLQQRVPRVLAKLSPTLSDEVLRELGGSVVFLSEERTCKEASVLFHGEPAPSAAVLLPSGVRFEAAPDPPLAASLGAWLIDPDPALVRAGALGALGIPRISREDAYLTAPEPLRSPAVRCYRIREVLSYRERVLGPWLREQGIGRLVVKKRRFPKEPAEVVRALKLSGKGEEATLVLVAQERGWLAVVCDSLMPL